jgi:DNA-binding IclR family transcriptional regulator
VHASSSGKVIVAFGDPALRDAICRRPLERLTAATVVSAAHLRELWSQARRQGYAASSGELEEGLVTIAAPVVVDGSAVAALSVSGPAYRLPKRDVPRLARHVMDAAAAASHRMAGR